MIFKHFLAITILFASAFTTANAQKLLGGDISLLPSYEAKNAVYKDKDGKSIANVITFMKDQGCNSMRVRLFVDPSKAPEEHKKEGVVQDLEYVKALGGRIKAAGLHFLLDFHYSDTWTDPGKHSTPDAWKNMTPAELAEQMYTYTKESLQALKDAGAEPDAIQVGNEVNLGQLWNSGKTWPTAPTSTEMQNFISYINNAIKACREVCPQAKVVFHVAMNYRKDYPNNSNDQAKNWSSLLKNKEIDYDIFGLSYYPYYHGPMTQLDNLLTFLESNIPDKKIQLVEAGYPNKYYPGDAIFDYTSTYPDTEEGQRKFTADLITTLNAHQNVDGLYWWYPEANGNYFADSWYNMGLWNNSTHRALKALYELKNFLPEDPSGITSPMVREQEDTVYYDLLGIRHQGKPANKGIYIHQNSKVAVR